MNEPFPNSLLQEAARRFGTPLYLYSEEVITRQFRAIDAALSSIPHLVCYAVKANSNLSLLKLFRELGCGFDIVSGGELQRVLASGGSASSVVYSGVGKRDDEIRLALESNILFFNVESSGELSRIEALAAATKKRAKIALRVNPNISVETHPYLATGIHSSKFGIPTSDIDGLWERIGRSASLELVGIDCHIGSQITDVLPFRDAYSEILTIAHHLSGKGAPIRYIDLGGGFGVKFSGHYTPLDLSSYSAMIQEVTRGTPYQYIVEPGKFLVSEAGALLTEVLLIKQNGSKKFAVVDAGMNDLIRPALYEAFHHIDLVGEDVGSRARESIDVVGPVCESGCFLALDRALPEVRQGELLLVRDAGAYGFSMASNYNSRPLPAEVLVSSNGTLQLIRKRQAVASLWQDELVTG